MSRAGVGKREVEHTYEPADDTVEVPDLGGLPGVVEVREGPHLKLVAQYYDTPDLDLIGSKVTLRRRQGGHDDGWHVKVPRTVGRDEVHWPLTTGEHPPDDAAAAVDGWVRDKPLTMVAELVTDRRTTLLCGADDIVLAELVDDRVQARVVLPDDAETLFWREWEVELVDGKTGLLAQVDSLLADQGVPLAAAQSKLLRALGSRVREAAAVPEVGAKGPARDVVLARLMTLSVDLQKFDSDARRGVPDGVHRTRVTLRRLRATLGAFRPLFEHEPVAALRRELQWAARALGAARDSEVVRALLLETLDGLVGRDDLDPAELRRLRAAVDREMTSVEEAAETDQLAAMRSERYYAMLDDLDALIADPAWARHSGRKARDVLPPLVNDEVDRLRRYRAAAKRLEVGTEDYDLAMHEVRKRAKRVRYAAEALAPAFGAPADGLATAASKLASALGEQHDCAVARGRLHDVALDSSPASTAADRALVARITALHSDVKQLYKAVRRASPTSW